MSALMFADASAPTCRPPPVSPDWSVPTRQTNASGPVCQSQRVNRPGSAIHVCHVPRQQALPRSCAACGIRPFDHHHQQPSDSASGSAVRPAKVAICTVSLAGLWKLVAAPDPGQHRRPPSPRPAEPTRLPRRVPARPGSHQTSRSAPPKPRSRKPAAMVSVSISSGPRKSAGQTWGNRSAHTFGCETVYFWWVTRCVQHSKKMCWTHLVTNFSKLGRKQWPLLVGKRARACLPGMLPSVLPHRNDPNTYSGEVRALLWGVRRR